MFEKEHIGAVVSAGVDAVFGDTVVAAAVISDRVDKTIVLETEQVDGGFRLWLVHRRYGRLATVSGTYDADREVLDYRVVPRTGLQYYLGDAFAHVIELADCTFAAGFCPLSEDELFTKFGKTVANFTKRIKSKYPYGILSTPELVDRPLTGESRLESMWGKNAPASVRVTAEAHASMTEAMKRRVVAATAVADAVAQGVRAARLSDLDTLYPRLQLMENGGLSSGELFMKLASFPIEEGPGFRGEITKGWISWFTSRGSNQVMPVDADVNPKTFRDDKNRECMVFDRKLAETTLSAVCAGKDDLDNWERNFIESVDAQFKRTRRLSPRQMFVLFEIHRRHH